MKLTLIGGGGVRTPLLVDGLVRWNEKVKVDELVLYDTDNEKLKYIGALVLHLIEQKKAPFKIRFTTDFRSAIKNTDFIYTAIRVGGEESRVIDEWVPLKYGILGQETTGPGGFAMALRTIPVILEFAKVIEEEAPDAWLVNFTNPSGLITEALQKYTKLKVIGICDAPSHMKLGIAKYLKVPSERVYINYFGLNHLGWVNKILVDGKNVLPHIIKNYREYVKVNKHMAAFSEDFIKNLKMLPNEYLYYYYYREQAVNNILNAQQTRGEQIVELNKKLLEALVKEIDKGNIDGAFDIYGHIMGERQNSYMSKEIGNVEQMESEQEKVLESEGYAGLAMSIISGILNNEKTVLILNVQNNGTIPVLNNDDVVEVPCLLDANGPIPLSVGEIPCEISGLLQTVKAYERYTVKAAVYGSYDDALMALTIHPLVGSTTLAKKILHDYLELHGKLLPQFSQKHTLANN